MLKYEPEIKLDHDINESYLELKQGQSYTNLAFINWVNKQNSDILKLAFRGNLNKFGTRIQKLLPPSFKLNHSIRNHIFEAWIYPFEEAKVINCSVYLQISVDGKSEDLYLTIERILKATFFKQLSCKNDRIHFQKELEFNERVKNIKDFEPTIQYCHAIYRKLSDLSNVKFSLDIKLH